MILCRDSTVLWRIRNLFISFSAVLPQLDRDWANNINTVLTPYPNCSDCEVHAGFYRAEQAFVNNLKMEVSSLLSKFPSYSIVVTGHSLGAAMATLTALDLSSITANSVTLINFGSPRVGNEAFAAFASEIIKIRYRVTHYRDVVPHLPWANRFTHISGEWYEDQDGSLHQCEGYEDKNCSYQWYYLTIEDHLIYLKFNITSCEAVS